MADPYAGAVAPSGEMHGAYEAWRRGLSVRSSETPSIVELHAQGDHRDAVLAIIQALLNMYGFDASHPIDLDGHRLEIVLPAGWRALPIVQMTLPGLAAAVASFLKGEGDAA